MGFLFVFFIIAIDIIAIMIVNVSLFVVIVEPGLLVIINPRRACAQRRLL